MVIFEIVNKGGTAADCKAKRNFASVIFISWKGMWTFENLDWFLKTCYNRQTQTAVIVRLWCNQKKKI